MQPGRPTQLQDDDVVPPQHRYVASRKPHRRAHLHPAAGFRRRRRLQRARHLDEIESAARGAPLADLAVKVTDGFFLMGLSDVNADRARNIQLLSAPGWTCRWSTPTSDAPSSRSKRAAPGSVLVTCVKSHSLAKFIVERQDNDNLRLLRLVS